MSYFYPDEPEGSSSHLRRQPPALQRKLVPRPHQRFLRRGKGHEYNMHTHICRECTACHIRLVARPRRLMRATHPCTCDTPLHMRMRMGMHPLHAYSMHNHLRQRAYACTPAHVMHMICTVTCGREPTKACTIHSSTSSWLSVVAGGCPTCEDRLRFRLRRHDRLRRR